MAEGDDPALRDQLASFGPLLALSMVLFGTADDAEILRLATSAVPSFGPLRTEAVWLDDAWWMAAPRERDPTGDLAERLTALGRGDGPIDVGGARWGWAYPLNSLAGTDGYVVVAAEATPEDHEHFLVGVLIQQAAAALANARLHARERDIAERLRESNLALERLHDEAERAAAAARRSLAVHDRLTRVAAAGEGPQGIALAVHELTGRTVVIEDRYGNELASAGPPTAGRSTKGTAAKRQRLLRQLAAAGGPVKQDGSLLVLARAGENQGIIALQGIEDDPRDDHVVLEHAATVFALELAHRRSLAETELRLRRDLVEELLAGTDVESARERARALGYDLDRPHRVVVVSRTSKQGDGDELFHAVRRAIRDQDIGSLLVARSGTIAVLSDADGDWLAFREAVATGVGSGAACRIGVSAPCTDPGQFPRAHEQAQLALKVQATTDSQSSVTVFEDLGIYRLLAEAADLGSVEGFVHHWLGALLDYDAGKGSELVLTLTRYLEAGGSYDATAEALNVHRSTLRYRLQRIRELSGYDLADPDTRFNLHLAARAWATIRALRLPAPAEVPP